jgi:hypothetical protein
LSIAYHYIFPRFQKTGVMVALTKTLRAQHQAGRRLTRQIEGLARLPLAPLKKCFKSR